MAHFKAVTIPYQIIVIMFVTTVLMSNEETEKNCIFGTAMPGHQESLKLRPRPRLPLHTFIIYMV